MSSKILAGYSYVERGKEIPYTTDMENRIGKDKYNKRYLKRRLNNEI